MLEIYVRFHSQWRNRFLDGDNNEPLAPKKTRPFIASSQRINLQKGLQYANPGHDTVMGVLNRLIGDQRKLHQSRSDNEYYFGDMEANNQITFEFKDEIISHEVVSLRDPGISDDPSGGVVGVMNISHPLFSSLMGRRLWHILRLNKQPLLNFIQCGELPNDFEETVPDKSLSPLQITNLFAQAKKRFDAQNKIDKSVWEKENNQEYDEAVSQLKIKRKEAKAQKRELSETETALPPKNKWTKTIDIAPLREKLLDLGYTEEQANPERVSSENLYCAALYQRLRFLQEEDEKATRALTESKGNIKGVSIRTFTAKDIMLLATSDKKRRWGGPYLYKPKSKSEPTQMLRKAQGELIITLEIDDNKALEVKHLIEAAGVPPFRLGKKGLAYIKDVRIT